MTIIIITIHESDQIYISNSIRVENLIQNSELINDQIYLNQVSLSISLKIPLCKTVK